MDTLETYLQPVLGYLRNPYVVGVLSILAIVYGSLLAPQLPPTVASWFTNPIFKVLFIFLILAVRNINPTVAILLTLGLIISMQTLNRYRVFTMANEVSQMTATRPGHLDTTIHPSDYQRPTDEEINQYNQEMTRQLNQMDASQSQMTPTSIPIHESTGPEPSTGLMTADQQPLESLHPKNRPTTETNLIKRRVEDPNAPEHPDWRASAHPNLAAYELNPPFLRKNIPQQHVNPQNIMKPENEQINNVYEDPSQPTMAPQRTSTRYSAYHGYPLNTQPLSVNQDPALPPMANNQLMANTQALGRYTGYPGRRQGAEYGTTTSEI